MSNNKNSRLSNLVDEASLVQRTMAGDIAAEQEIVERYQSGLRTILFNSAKDKEVVDEVLQDTWLVVLKKVRAGELRDANKLRQFIIQVGKNQLLMYFRSRSKYSERYESYSHEPVADNLSAEQQIENRRLGMTITALFEKLPQKRDREILEQFYVKGTSKQDLCEEYQLSHAHFDRVLYRARERFKTLWHQNQSNN